MGKERQVLRFVGKANVSRITETTKLDRDGGIDEVTTYDLRLEDDDGHKVGLRQLVPFDVRPGEWLEVTIVRTQARLDEATT